MKTNELNEILRKHKMWLNNEDGGVRANLSNADLSNADLSNADLSRDIETYRMAAGGTEWNI